MRVSQDTKPNSAFSRYRLFFPHAKVRDDALVLVAVFSSLTDRAFSLNDLRIEVGPKEYKPKIYSLNSNVISRRHFGIINLVIPHSDLQEMSIHNNLKAYYIDKEGNQYNRRKITYDVFLRRYFAKHTKGYKDTAAGTVSFFRQNMGRAITLTVRHQNITDLLSHRMMILLAWALSCLPFGPRPVLLYEKNGGRYEESARSVFEYLVDHGFANSKTIRYIASDRLCNDNSIPERYRQLFVKTHTLTHYYLFFRAQTFIGTEAMSHSLELRCQSYLVQRKLRDDDNRYVFLQHGVMYMVSLDSPQRTSFRRSSMPRNTHVIVSSEKEANHFIELAGFDKNELIVSGLPKFDRSVMAPNSDRIVIMPTWRIWEFNQIRTDPKKSGYYKMINSIIDSVPLSLKDKVVVCPHPLFNQATFGGDAFPNPYGTIDEALAHARVFITDYSSAAYDAFYRGSSVIFYWRDLDECMQHYGGSTHLMLSEDDAFGDVVYKQEGLRELIERAYYSGQSSDSIIRYRTIVKYHDRNNTVRCVQELYKLGLFD